MKPITASATLCALLFIVSVAHAQDHDGGFFIRVGAGLNTGTSSIDDQTTGTKELSGIGLDGELAAGWVLVPNFALHGTFFGWRTYDPAIGKLGGEADGHITLRALGVGATYFVMPTNLYLSATLAAATQQSWVDNIWSQSNLGFAFEFVVGKEWFIGGGLGVGGSVGVVYHTVHDNSDDRPAIDASWSGFHLPIRLTATFN